MCQVISTSSGSEEIFSQEAMNPSLAAPLQPVRLLDTREKTSFELS